MAYICICNAVKESELIEIIKNNPSISIKDLQRINIGNCCKKCLIETKQILNKSKLGEIDGIV